MDPDQLTLLALGEAPDGTDDADLTAHLRQCAVCSTEVDELRATVLLARESVEYRDEAAPPPEGVWNRIAAETGLDRITGFDRGPGRADTGFDRQSGTGFDGPAGPDREPGYDRGQGFDGPAGPSRAPRSDRGQGPGFDGPDRVSGFERGTGSDYDGPAGRDRGPGTGFDGPAPGPHGAPGAGQHGGGPEDGPRDGRQLPPAPRSAQGGRHAARDGSPRWFGADGRYVGDAATGFGDGPRFGAGPGGTGPGAGGLGAGGPGLGGPGLGGSGLGGSGLGGSGLGGSGLSGPGLGGPGVDGPGPGWAETASARRRRRWVRPAAALLAAAAVGVVGTLGAVRPWQEDVAPRQTTASAASLAPVTGGPGGVTGRAVVVQGATGLELEISAEGLPLQQGYYEVWVFDGSSRMVSVGVLGPRSTAVLPLPPTLDLRTFNVVDISQEQYDGKQVHSEVSVLRGTLTG